MKSRTVKELLNANMLALKEVKGHSKATVKTCILLLNELPQDLSISVRRNTATPSNAGDIAEVVVGYMLDRKDFYGVSLGNKNDLNTARKNEVKLCYSNNRPSNDIQDKGHYMIDVLSGKVRLTFISRHIVRACKQYLIKGKRGGKTYAEAVLNYMN